MLGALLNIPKKQFELHELPIPKPLRGEVLIKLQAVAFNHLESWALLGAFPSLPELALVGSDGAGRVVAVGEQVAQNWIGSDVLINPALRWGDGDVPGAEFTILGVGRPGVFAQYACVPIESVYLRPAHLTAVEAAALPLAALTAYRALLSRADVHAGQKVLITGIGGGVALQAMQMALQLGAEVYVTSSSDEKVEKARELGAAAGANYTLPDWAGRLGHVGFDAILDSSGQAMNALLSLIKPGGKVVNIGMTSADTSTISLRLLFTRQANILGSAMGSPREFEAMLDLVSKSRIAPVVEKTFSLDAMQDAFVWQQGNQRFGKTVVTID